METRYPISTITIMGDSLSDRGTMYDRYLFGIFPMRYPSDLVGTSPKGRFTNGYTWNDHVSAALANAEIIKLMKKRYPLANDDIADIAVTRDRKYYSVIDGSYYLDNDKRVKLFGNNFVETYSEGGMTSTNYSCFPSWNISRFFTRQILTNLDAMRERVLADDKKQRVTLKQRKETLIVEWSGANDLITVNSEPSKIEVDRAIKSRIKNVIELKKAGYQHFVLFNLPDLSLTPRYQHRGSVERGRAHCASMYFNSQLEMQVNALRKSYPDISISIFDVCSELTMIFNDPLKFGLDPAKKSSPFIKSPDFKIKQNKTSPAKGYMFWDDVHPTADVHAGLAALFYQACLNKKYAIQSIPATTPKRTRRNSMS